MQDNSSLDYQMSLALAGDKTAYGVVLKEAQRLLLPYLTRVLSNPNAAEDVLQETLISLHKARHTYDGNRPFTPWLFAIARFRLKDYLRRCYADNLRHAAPLEDAENISFFPVTSEGLTYEHIKEQVAQLPEKQATIVQLIHEQGFTAKEVATQLGMQENAVKVAAHRAYKVLKKGLER